MAVFKTTEAYISGGICGHMWWPNAMAGKPLRREFRFRGPWNIWQDGDTFRDALDRLLTAEGGDFQDPKFTADTRVVVVRRKHDGATRIIHVWERELTSLNDCGDMVNDGAFVSDFMGDD